VTTNIPAWPLTDEQRQIVELCKDFAAKEIRPRGREVDEADVVNAAIASMAWAHGFIGLWRTGNLAGLGDDPIALARQTAEALGRLAAPG